MTLLVLSALLVLVLIVAWLFTLVGALTLAALVVSTLILMRGRRLLRRRSHTARHKL